MTKYNRDFLVHEVAARANFTISDVRIILSAIEEVIRDIIAERSQLILSGLFWLSVGEIKEHEGVNPRKKERIQIPKANRIKIKASRALYPLLKE
jgi:nucleoid DNA-binding protein